MFCDHGIAWSFGRLCIYYIVNKYTCTCTCINADKQVYLRNSLQRQSPTKWRINLRWEKRDPDGAPAYTLQLCCSTLGVLWGLPFDAETSQWCHYYWLSSCLGQLTFRRSPTWNWCIIGPMSPERNFVTTKLDIKRYIKWPTFTMGFTLYLATQSNYSMPAVRQALTYVAHETFGACSVCAFTPHLLGVHCRSATSGWLGSKKVVFPDFCD